MFSCENLACVRGDKILFRHLGFSTTKGGLLVLSGPNGCGKTSLLRVLAGLAPADAGKVLWQGKPIKNNAAYMASMLYIGHQNAIKPELTVYDNVQFWAALRGTEMLVPAALQFFNLTPMIDIPAGQLSTGWQRRVALARLLATPSTLWLLDEPATNLDAAGQVLLEGLIETRVEKGGMVILSSHHTASAATACLHIDDFAEARHWEQVYDAV